MMLRNTSCALAAAVALFAASGSAHAVTQCYDNTTGNPTPKTPLYLTGSSALGVALQGLAPSAAAAGYTLVYFNQGSCAGIAGTSTTNTIPATGTVIYYPADGSAALPCKLLDGPGGNPTTAAVDVVLSDVDARLCPTSVVNNGTPNNLPAGFTDTHGPVNAMIFAVPSNSQQSSISAEQAYLVFGLGVDGAVSPWTGDPMTTHLIRSPTSGTRAMINANIGGIDQGGVDANNNPGKGPGTKGWLGAAQADSKTVANGLGTTLNASVTTANPAIGIIGMNDLISFAGTYAIKPLAFRAFQQLSAYYPGSTQNAKDMRNTRDGRYKIWGYVHMITPTTATAAAQAFFTLINGPDAVDGVVKSGLTPVCAMHVTHDYEGQDQKPFSADKPCDCYFEFKATGAAPASCKSCTSNTDCTGGGRCDLHGSVGYCEAK